jgi:hypothetical protein
VAERPPFIDGDHPRLVFGAELCEPAPEVIRVDPQICGFGVHPEYPVLPGELEERLQIFRCFNNIDDNRCLIH